MSKPAVIMISCSLAHSLFFSLSPIIHTVKHSHWCYQAIELNKSEHSNRYCVWAKPSPPWPSRYRHVRGIAVTHIANIQRGKKQLCFQSQTIKPWADCLSINCKPLCRQAVKSKQLQKCMAVVGQHDRPVPELDGYGKFHSSQIRYTALIQLCSLPSFTSTCSTVTATITITFPHG